MKSAQIALLSLVGVASARYIPRADTSCVLTSTLPAITVTRCEETTSVLTECPEPTPSTTYIYTTEYENLCSTGVETKTYTITKTCDAAPCTCTAGEVPSDFTVTVTTCTTCGAEPVTTTTTTVASSGMKTAASLSAGLVFFVAGIFWL
ncbi:hypothetical protein CMQ_2664 [Grosmannia clavigera kw1407]|uniref:Uncharacterized protein n=1 Tax=Grosmannia clavigera (strain kw1407 / UAMH 11150) TaxID=655863 RepID=F0XHS9_GROCL|nr:uncharacterized protein CMQ_2664 [Grosmannia clavigera kw1407]EFX02735.1 hypothetical protein CMQ_2664 [Grosmannia clavigera kw1407]